MSSESETKTCSACGEPKPRDAAHFAPSKAWSDGWRAKCLGCVAADDAALDNETNRSASNQRYWVRHKHRINQRRREDRGFIKQTEEERRASGAKAARNYRSKTKLQMVLDPLLGRHRSLIPRHLLLAKTELEWLGCSFDELCCWLEVRFQGGMGWHNRGDWHIDNILPLKAFCLTDPRQIAIACHHTNLQPLWASQNVRKSSTLPKPVALAIRNWRRDTAQPFPPEVRAWQASPNF